MRTGAVRQIAVTLSVVCAWALPTLAQNTPFVADEWKYGRRQDQSTLRYCLDARDPDFKVAQRIGATIANALLLEGKETVIGEGLVSEDLDNLYQVFLERCDLYLGFKLIADAYPSWLRVTRPYYQASYVLATSNPQWRALSDLPVAQAIATTMGTSADLRLAQYLMALPGKDRWPRFPMSNDRAAVDAVLSGTAGAALVWEPGLWALRETDATLAKLRAISPRPMPESAITVGAALLANEAFLRSNVDQAIATLTDDGTIQAILNAFKFPAKVVKP